MQFLHHGIKYSLPDEWWAEAGMVGFVPTRSSFSAGPSPWANLVVLEVPIDDVHPLLRRGSDGVFNDNPDSGSAHDRVVDILCGFRENSPIPPVEVATLPAGSPCKFKLVHGAHRFYCAVAAGFSEVPAVEVDDIWGTPALEA
jgi:hypothetical protein